MNALQNVDVDWEIVLRVGNRWYDRVVTASRKRTRGERVKAMADIREKYHTMQKVAKAANSIKQSDGDFAHAISERLAESLAMTSSPSLLLGIDVADRVAVQSQLIGVAFALAAFRADHGKYPEKLTELAPKYFAAVPKDFLGNDADLRYRQEGSAYLLYSVGPNGKDDGGKTREDRYKPGAPEAADWDDLVVRMPQEEPKSKTQP